MRRSLTCALTSQRLRHPALLHLAGQPQPLATEEGFETAALQVQLELPPRERQFSARAGFDLRKVEAAAVVPDTTRRVLLCAHPKAREVLVWLPAGVASAAAPVAGGAAAGAGSLAHLTLASLCAAARTPLAVRRWHALQSALRVTVPWRLPMETVAHDASSLDDSDDDDLDDDSNALPSDRGTSGGGGAEAAAEALPAIPAAEVADRSLLKIVSPLTLGDGEEPVLTLGATGLPVVYTGRPPCGAPTDFSFFSPQLGTETKDPQRIAKSVQEKKLDLPTDTPERGRVAPPQVSVVCVACRAGGCLLIVIVSLFSALALVLLLLLLQAAAAAHYCVVLSAACHSPRLAVVCRRSVCTGGDHGLFGRVWLHGGQSRLLRRAGAPRVVCCSLFLALVVRMLGVSRPC